MGDENAVPRDWQVKPIEECMSAIIDYRGKTPRKTSFGVPLVTAKIVKNGRIETPNEFIASTEYDAWMRRGMPEPGDVVMTTEAPLGEVAQLGCLKVALAQRLITLRGKPNLLDNTFLKFLMQSDFVQEQLTARATGTTVLGIKQSELRKVALLVPPLPEQRAIASFLGALDDKIELNRRMNATLESIARSIFKSWFVDFDPVRAKMDGRKPPGMDDATAALFPDEMEHVEGRLVPSGWKLQRFSDGIEILSGGTPKTSKDEYWSGTIPWYTVKDAPADADIWVLDTERHVSQAGIDTSATEQFDEATTIISARGTVGKLALTGVPMAMNQSCYGIRGVGGYPPFFTYFNVRTLVSSLQQRTHGTVFDTITRQTFETLSCCYPTIEVCQAFDGAVDNHLRRIHSNLRQAKTLSTLRDALLPKLLSGELRVCEAEEILADQTSSATPEATS